MLHDTQRISHFEARPAAPPGALAKEAKTHALPSPTAATTIESVATHVTPFDLNKADLAFPPVRQPSLQVRRYTRRVGSSNSRPKFLCKVTPRVFNVLWLSVLAIHIACAMYLGFIGALYFYLLGTALMGYLTLYGVAVEAFFLPPIGLAYFCVCGIHAYSVATIVFHSIWSQRSVFTSTQFPNRTVTTPVMRIRRMSQTALSSIEFRTSSVLGRLPSPFVRNCFILWNGLGKLYKASDVRNECYDSVYITRLAMVTLCHVYQLYLGSLYYPHSRLKSAWVSLVVANCLIPPLLTAVFRRNPPRTRLLCIAINLVVDVAVLVVLPSIVLQPYFHDYDSSRTNFSANRWYQDRWFITALNEVHLLHVSSAIDFITKLGVAWNVSRGLRIYPLVLHKVDPADVAVAPEEATEDGTAPGSFPDDNAGFPAPASPASSEVSQSSMKQLVVIVQKGWRSIEGAGSLLTVLTGIAMLVVHIHSIRYSIPSDCRLPIHPWFTTKPSCSLLEYRCIEPGQTGRALELDALIQRYDPRLVSFLSIRYCSQVEIPRSVRELHNLVAIKIYKSTIAQWGEDAELTGASHPRLRSLFLVDVNMSELPRGLLSAEFPAELYDVEICRTNLTVLPDAISKVWPAKMSLVFEEFPFQEFPSVLTSMAPSSISLAKSNISSIPSEIMTSEALFFLILNGNPIADLPADITVGSRLYWLSLHSTLVQTIPPPYGAVSIDAGDTPHCTNREGETSMVDCTKKLSTDELTLYPIELEEFLNG